MADDTVRIWGRILMKTKRSVKLKNTRTDAERWIPLYVIEDAYPPAKASFDASFDIQKWYVESVSFPLKRFK